MSKKRVSYQNLLKEAIAEFDTSKTVDVKGPMLDPILKWDGDGELPIFKDAASILERYYFNESSDEGVEVSEMEYNEDGTEAKTASEKDAEGTGTQQAGTSSKPISGEKDEIAKDLAKEDWEWHIEQEGNEDEEDEEDEDEEKEEMEESLENQVIEKLIAEMEEEDEDEDEEMTEMDMTYTGEGPKFTNPKEKKASGPDQDAQGAGTQQAGTGDAEGQIPPRKDLADEFTKAKTYSEDWEWQLEQDGEKEDEGGEEEELDVDKEVSEAGAAGHVPPPGMQKKMKGEDEGDDDLYEEAFAIFKEAIEDEEDEDENDNEEE